MTPLHVFEFLAALIGGLGVGIRIFGACLAILDKIYRP